MYVPSVLTLSTLMVGAQDLGQLYGLRSVGSQFTVSLLISILSFLFFFFVVFCRVRLDKLYLEFQEGIF